MKITNPMMKAVFSSERMNAGISVDSGTWSRDDGAFSPDALMNRLSSPRRVWSNMKSRSGTCALSYAWEKSILPSSSGCSASSLIFDNVGAITNRLRNIARPMTTWFGGIDGRPSALRVNDSTITMRVKLGEHDQQRGRDREHGEQQDDDDALVGLLAVAARRAPPRLTLIDASLPRPWSAWSGPTAS